MKLVIFDLDDTLFDTTGQLQGSHEKVDSVIPFPGTIPLLTFLKQKGIKTALVSTYKSSKGIGDASVQERKINALGIRSFFDTIALCADGEEKLAAFKNVIEKSGIENREEIVVIGDRIDREIMYGNMLGCTTVRLLHGKRKDLAPEHSGQVPKFTINSLEDFLPVVPVT